MSGICGFVHFDDRPAEGRELDPMLAALASRGPDGLARWADRHAALGFAKLATTAEAVGEVQPFIHSQIGCAIVADARLDNREELLLLLSPQERSIGEAELILLAFLKWGENCVDHLFGDFAFAIWSPRERRLFAARDQLGNRQLCYFHRPGALLAFATEPKAVVALGPVPDILNECRVADFLFDVEGQDAEETFYENVFRLPAAHILACDPSGISVRRYWTLAIPQQLQLAGDADYCEAFLEVFRRAIKARLRSTGRVGALLSGGIDSSSVCAIAAPMLKDDGRGPLKTFSVIAPKPNDCIESRTIIAAGQIQGIEPTLVDYRDAAATFDWCAGIADPFDAHMTLSRIAYRAASRQGIRVVLDGLGGDVVMGSENHVEHLLRKVRIFEAARELRGERAFSGGEGLPASFARAAYRAFAPAAVKFAVRRARWKRSDRVNAQGRFISNEFKSRSGIADRLDQVRRRNSQFDRIDCELARRIDHQDFAVAHERFDRVAASFGVESRDPFTDLKLIEFALSLPLSQRQRGGWPKILLRRAMQGLLPDTVRWRRGKFHLGWDVTRHHVPAPSSLGTETRKSTRDFVNWSGIEWNSSTSSGAEGGDVWVRVAALTCWLNANRLIASAPSHGESARNESEFEKAR